MSFYFYVLSLFFNVFTDGMCNENNELSYLHNFKILHVKFLLLHLIEKDNNDLLPPLTHIKDRR